MPYTLGIDVSTRKLAFVLLRPDGRVESTHEATATGPTALSRFDELVFLGTDYLAGQRDARERDGLRVVIEGVPFVKNRLGFGALAQVVGAVRGACAWHGIPYVVAAGHEWKRGVGLGGNANKAAIATWARARADAVEGWSQDLMDAYGLAVYGQAAG